ncbi:MAG TPA: hypothetical protein DCX53_15830, partial [Anaerolineae bacterium]|nr:hypothetical protein [Anaerolineae bacterium]
MKRELGIFERAQVIADRYSPFHIVAVLRLENAPLPDILQKSFNEARKRHPFLSAHLTNEDGHYYFESLTYPLLPFHILPRRSNEQWVQVVESELATRIDTATGPMFRCTYLFDEARKQAEIILAISHSIADAASVSQLLHEVMTTCASPSDGTPDSVFELSPA